MTVVEFGTTDIKMVDDAEVYRDLMGRDHPVTHRQNCNCCGRSLVLHCRDGFSGSFNALHIECVGGTWYGHQ